MILRQIQCFKPMFFLFCFFLVENWALTRGGILHYFLTLPLASNTVINIKKYKSDNF